MSIINTINSSIDLLNQYEDQINTMGYSSNNTLKASLKTCRNGFGRLSVQATLLLSAEKISPERNEALEKKNDAFLKREFSKVEPLLHDLGAKIQSLIQLSDEEF